MTGKNPQVDPPKKKRGPEPDTLAIRGEWREAVKVAVNRPPAPKPAERKKGA